MKHVFRLVWTLFFLLLLAGCDDGPKGIHKEIVTCKDCAIEKVSPVGDYLSIPYVGDIWTATWADDDNLYLAFGDATGMNGCLPTLFLDEPDEFDRDYVEESPGCYRVSSPETNEYCEVFGCTTCLPLCQYTPAGMLRLTGEVPNFATCEGDDQCVISRHIPYGDLRVFEQSDKPSSVVFIEGRMYMHMHYPPGEPTYGYLAYSDDYGETWDAIPGSPWQENSPFKVMMFINMGKAYTSNRDGWLYALGTPYEVAAPPDRQPVYLTRVRIPETPKPAVNEDPILDYGSYEYFAGVDGAGAPIWSVTSEAAVRLEGLETLAQASAVYHEQSQRFLFLTGFWGTAPGTEVGLSTSDEVPVGAFYESPTPWGPWHIRGFFPAGYIASILPKGMERDTLYFTASGGGGVTYNLNIRQFDLDLCPPETAPLFSPVSARKVEQIIGDIDFETMQPNRQQTWARFNVGFTDLGSPFEHQGKLWLLFGDTDPEAPGWNEHHDDSIAYTTASSTDEFYLTFLTDPDSGRGYLNPTIRCPDQNNDDCVDLGTLNVPVAGLSDRSTVFVWFTTGGADRSVATRSDDHLRTFVKLYDFGDTHFIDIAAASYENDIPGLPPGKAPWVLLFGSGDPLNKQVYLAATPVDRLRRGDREAVYFLSRIYNASGQVDLKWGTEESQSTPLFCIEHGPGIGIMSEVPHGWGFGEPLIHYNKALGLWVATYNAGRVTIRLRTASEPWGPWSESIVLFDPAADYGEGPAYGRYIGDGVNPDLGDQGELYGPYVLERYTSVKPDGRVKLYWLLSPWQPYVVYLMETTLEPVNGSPPPPRYSFLMLR